MSLDEFRRQARGRQAAAYLDFFAPVTELFLPALAERLGSGPGVALDLACGDGRLATRLRSTGWSVVALDRSMEMVWAARAAGLPSPVAGDACALPLRTGAVDAVGAAFVLPHLPQLPVALAEIRRVLAPGGPVALTGWTDPATSPLTGLLTQLLLGRADADTLAGLRAAEDRSDAEPVLAALRAAGFTEQRAGAVTGTVAIASPATWWTGLVTGSFGIGQVVNAQPPAVQQALRADFLAMAEDFSIGDGLLVPVAAHVISAR